MRLLVDGASGAQRLPASRRGGPSSLDPEAAPRSRVLNAFRHHGEGDVRSSSVNRESVSRAQRLPASRRGGRSPPFSDRTSSSSAQRLPASRRGGHLLGRGGGARHAVLNAFRHHGEGDDCIPRPARSPPLRAQRLPASRRGGLLGSVGEDELSYRAQRLPASRRGGRHVSTTRSDCRACAQRLPASRRGGLRAAGASPPSCPSAQRLPASRRGGHGHVIDPGGRMPVLNAFRHHGEGDPALKSRTARPARCSTPSGITARGTRMRKAIGFPTVVLNAFRHHGEWGRPVIDRKSKAGSGAQRLPASRRGGQARQREALRRWTPVLNAFRHHGEGDLRLSVGDRIVHPLCSTPSGITARGTWLERWRANLCRPCSTPSGITARGTVLGMVVLIIGLSGAQRLPASRRAGPGHSRSGYQAGSVLNAFRHHGERDGGFSLGEDESAGAQRLPASRRAGLRGELAIYGVE